MQIVMSYDAVGRKFIVYRVKLEDGSYVEVDADLADQCPNGPEAFVAAEVKLHKAEMD